MRKCASPPLINGTSAVEDKNSIDGKQRAVYSCIPGTEKVNNASTIVYCQQNGEWSTSDILCKGEHIK